MKAIDYIRTAPSERKYADRFREVQSELAKIIDVSVRNDDARHFTAAEVLRHLLATNWYGRERP